MAVRRRDRSPSSYATYVTAGPNASRMKRPGRSSEGTFPGDGRNSSSRVLKRPGSAVPRSRLERHLPPPPPSRSRTSVPGGVKDSMLGGPSAGVFPLAGDSADDPAFHDLMTSVLEGLASRDESIRELTARLHRLEGEHDAGLSPLRETAPREGTAQRRLADGDYREARAEYAWNADELNESLFPRQRHETIPGEFESPDSINGGVGTHETNTGISATVHVSEAFSQRNRDDSGEHRADASTRLGRLDREGQDSHRKVERLVHREAVVYLILSSWFVSG